MFEMAPLNDGITSRQPGLDLEDSCMDAPSLCSPLQMQFSSSCALASVLSTHIGSCILQESGHFFHATLWLFGPYHWIFSSPFSSASTQSSSPYGVGDFVAQDWTRTQHTEESSQIRLPSQGRHF